MPKDKVMDVRITTSKGFLKYPKHKVIALLDDSDSLQHALSELAYAGFKESEIEVLSGPEAAAGLDVEGHHHGLKSRVYRFVERLGDIPDWLEQHRRHIADGGFGVAVPADKYRKEVAAWILAKHGAHDGAYFGTARWESIGQVIHAAGTARDPG
jgi:hypothetical protein